MSEPFLGQITMFGFNFAPRNWAFCNGALMPITQNQALFALLGTAYGGDGRTNYALPNLISRSPVGFAMGSNHPGLDPANIGDAGGRQYTTLSTGELPPHNHTAVFTSTPSTPTTFSATTETGELSTPTADSYLAAPSDIPGADQPEKIFKENPSEGSMVNLGGITTGDAHGSVQIGNTGNGNSFSIQNPFLALNFSIALQGLFPSRN